MAPRRRPCRACGAIALLVCSVLHDIPALYFCDTTVYADGSTTRTRGALWSYPISLLDHFTVARRQGVVGTTVGMSAGMLMRRQKWHQVACDGNVCFSASTA